MSQYKFKNPFEYAYKGEMETAQFLEMLPPTGRHITEVAPVKQAIMAAAYAADQASTGDAEVSGEGELDGPTIMAMLEIHGGDLTPLILCTMSMLSKGKLGLVDGEEKFTQKLVDDLSIEDTYGIVGQFIADFIMPSL